MPITLLCIHGNHERRPTAGLGYERAQRFGGEVMVQPEFPNQLFALDGEVYELDGQSCIAIGGAYSIDKEYRLMRGGGWWPDEQPSAAIKRKVESVLASRGWQADIVLSHTTPLSLEPRRPSCPSSTSGRWTRARRSGWTASSVAWTTSAGTPGISTRSKRPASCG